MKHLFYLTLFYLRLIIGWSSSKRRCSNGHCATASRRKSGWSNSPFKFRNQIPLLVYEPTSSFGPLGANNGWVTLATVLDWHICLLKTSPRFRVTCLQDFGGIETYTYMIDRCISTPRAMYTIPLYMQECIRIYLYMHECMHACMYVCMHVCISYTSAV